MASCAVPSVMAADTRFQELKEAYKDKHYNDDHLAQALQLCREYHGYENDWYPETAAQKGVFTRFLNYYLTNAKIAQTTSDLDRDTLYNLYTTLYALYTPEQLENRLNMLAHDFREVVSRLEENDRHGRSRQEIIKSLSEKNGMNGYAKVMQKVFDIYEKKYTDVDKMMESFDRRNPNATEEQRAAARKNFEYRVQEYKTILKNKDRLAALAAVKIGESEGFIVTARNLQIEIENITEEQLSEESEDTAETTGEDKEEGSKGERYGDYRTVKLMNSLGPRARRLISSIPKVDSSGKVIRDDLGVTQYLDGRQVAVVLKRTLVNSTPETMISDLEAEAEFHPWINGLLRHIRNNPDSRQTIYDNFKSAETTYVYVDFENGKYVPRIANSRSAGYALMREAGTNLRSGFVLYEPTSIYNASHGELKSAEDIAKIKEGFDSVKKTILAEDGAQWIRMVEGDKPFSKIDKVIDKASESGKDVSYLSLPAEDAMSAFLASHPYIPQKLAEYLRGMGFQVNANDIKTIALQTMKPKSWQYIVGFRGKNATQGRNKLVQLVNFMSGVYGRAEEIYKKGFPATGQYLYNTSDAFQGINKCLALSQYKEVEARVVNEGKALSTYNHVNLLHQVFDLLANKDGKSEKNYQDMLEEEYFQYEGMAFGAKENRQVFGWLRMLRDNESNIRENLRVVDISAFNHVEYAELSRPQKLTNSLIMYLDGSRIAGDNNYSGFEVPIQADYSTAYNFVLAPRLAKEQVIEELTNEVLLELDRIAAIEARQDDKNRIELKVYEEQGMKFQIFPAFNTGDFRQQYRSIDNAEAAKEFVKSRVSEELDKIVAEDFKTIESAKILTNPAFKNVDFGFGNYGSMFSEDGKVAPLSLEAKDKLSEYSMNVYYARQQMTKLLVGGTEQFNGLLDFEKRNMLTHATRSSLDTMATWNGVRVGRETQNVVYIEDDESKSAFLNDISKMLDQLKDEKVISESQYNEMVKAYSEINTTDGQGFRTFESYRTVCIMADEWDDAHEKAYHNIINGRPTKDDINLFMQNKKPVYTGYEGIPAATGDNQKPVKLTVLHKYSEAVLLPLTLAKYCLQTESAPLEAFETAQMHLSRQGKDIDMFLFHSGVKVGAHSILQPFAKQDGKRMLFTSKEISDYIVSGVVNNPATIHTLPFKYYGIAASTPAHIADDKIAWASQAEKVAWANVLEGQKITVRGKEMDAWDARELYFGIKTADIIESYTAIRKFFTNPDELEKVFQEELASKSYSSREILYALSHLKDGTFALPLFSPNIEHQIQELLSSIIKKRLTKPKVKGANILQVTGLGMDFESSNFDDYDSLSNLDKLQVVFDGTGKNKRIKYVEVYMPIHDSRLKMFADEDGNIGPDRLQKLIDNGTIPESMLEFIAYRTPSDAEHSVIPCRIKGFVANTGGATIMMPKEIMVMTGHDYDGDKMRCHFKNFKVVDKEENEIQFDDYDLVRMILGQKSTNEWRKCVVEEYDYAKSALENTQAARANARVELMFSELTSPAGSRRMLIPGGCSETKVIAKSMQIVRASRDTAVSRKLAEILGHSVKDKTELYNSLIRKSDKELGKILREISSLTTPFSVTHSADAFDYIMGGSQMIGIYATYNSALQMLQRLDMHYIPGKTKTEDKPYTISLFGNTFDKLFAVNNHRGRLASLGLARLLNAAVDNNKDPVLGYLNQTKELSELTFLMFAAGMTEEQIHLMMNQPSVIELSNRLKRRESNGLAAEVKGIVNELSANNERLGNISQWTATHDISEMRREDFISELATSYDELLESRDEDQIAKQINVLQTLAHLNVAAENLAKFVRLTRPESESGAIGTSVASIICKLADLNEFRNKIDAVDESEIRISGMKKVLAKRDVHEGWDTSYIEEILGLDLPEVVALNSLMLDTSPEMFQAYFPQARESWMGVARSIAEKYNYKTMQEGVVKKILSEMILFKLLNSKKFIQGDPQEEQKRILVDVPKHVQDLKKRVAEASRTPGKDSVADALVGNAFLEKLEVYFSGDPTSLPRLRFSINGAAVEGTRDLIAASWGAMLNSTDKNIQKLAIDLFKYNLYTNGFSYGMYEFAHFAPFSVLVSTPHYIEALQDILKSDWKDQNETANFINQYYMNHWGDKKFLTKLNIIEIQNHLIPVAEGITGQLWVSPLEDKNPLKRFLDSQRYIVIVSGTLDKQTQELYRIEKGTGTPAYVLVHSRKLGVRNRSGQVTLQYNPSVDYHFISPVVTGNDSAWGDLNVLNIYAQANINAPGMRPSDPLFGGQAATGPLGLKFFGIDITGQTLQNAEQKAEIAVAKNDAVLEEIPATEENSPMIPMNDAFAGLAGGTIDMDAMAAAAVRTSNEDTDGKMLQIVHRDATGNVVSEAMPVTPDTVRYARQQKVFVELNKRLREILREKGVSVGTLTNAEALMSIGGIADFDTASVTASGLVELIRLAEGYVGEQALPEEFAHVALEMLGHDNPLVQRLLNALNNSEESMQEAYDGMYQEYVDKYGEANKDKLVLEAAGKLVAKHLFLQQEIQSSPVRRLIYRISEAIKNFFKRFRREEVQNAILDANEIASKVARELLAGKLVDDMSLENISANDKYFKKVKVDLSGKNDILSRLLKTENKRLSILKKRLGDNTKDSKAYNATELQIRKLENGIANYKTEDAIVNYLQDALTFLAATEKSLDDAVESGRSANSVCQKLNTVRETLDSFVASLDDINDALASKEIQDSVGLTSAIDALSGVLSKFYTKYNKISGRYFEEMLSSVYGEHGKTITVGRDKGRVMSIHEMATRADSDISLASRWMHSIADCNDYVLKAIDDIVRNAKMRARRRAVNVRPRIEKAVTDLVRETGSRDQSFMFEMERGEDGKMHKTGSYISEEASKNLTSAQKKFYDTMMSILHDADGCLPEKLVTNDHHIIMVRKYAMDRFKDAEGAKGKALEAWDGLKNRIMDTSDNFDPENQEVIVGFSNNKVDMLPIKFTKKGVDESYDDMTDDVATSMMAYAGMAFEYDEMNGIVNILENAKYRAADRDIIQKTGRRTQRESIETDKYLYKEAFTKKAAYSNAQRALEDFFSMHVYGHVAANEGTIGNTRISKRKLVDFINMITSYSQMALNIPQRIANINTGLTQILIESIGNGEFSVKDTLRASAIYAKESGDRLAETGKTDYDNKLSLWDEYFDVHQDNGRYSSRYSKGRMSRVFNSSLLYAGLTMGEDYLANTTSLAVAQNIRVRDNKGKIATLWDAYEVRYLDKQNKSGAYLAVKEGWTKEDGTPITVEDERAFAKKVAGMNFELQGIYNLDDRSACQQYAFGALIIMYRKWIAPALKRRYADVNFNVLKGDYQEGYHHTLFRVIGEILTDAKNQVTEKDGNRALLNIVEDLKAIRTSALMNWNKMTDYEKSNLYRSWTELGIVIGLFVACSLIGKIPPPEYDDDTRGQMLKWWDKTLMSQMLRLRTEIGSQAPTPMFVDEALRILKSPFAAIAPLQNAINSIQLLYLPNYFNEIKSGRYRGHSKAYKYFRELPVISMFKKVDNFLDPSAMIQYYRNDSVL